MGERERERERVQESELFAGLRNCDSRLSSGFINVAGGSRDGLRVYSQNFPGYIRNNWPDGWFAS